MTALTPLGVRAGAWEALAEGSEPPPPLVLCHDGREVARAGIAKGDDGLWHVSAPIPAECLSEGIASFLVAEAGGGEALAAFTIETGPPGEDLADEVALLRAELELLKTTLRRHLAD